MNQQLINAVQKTTLADNIDILIASLQSSNLDLDSAWERGYYACIQSVADTFKIILNYSKR
jgi:hypothetical protein